MKNQEFIPILFGSDRNVYGMAVGFYQEYNIKSIAVCKLKYIETKSSRLIEFYQDENIENKDVFFKTLYNIKNKYNESKLILIACSDVYARLIIENKKELEKDFIVPYIDESLMNKLIIKENFYKTCDEFNFNYPKTIICTKENYQNLKIEFDYPIIVKPSDSVSYWKAKFPGKKKIFIIQSENEFKKILNDIYNSSYKNDLIIQEYIPGDDTNLYVLNAYVDSNCKTTFMALGQIVLEDKAPSSFGDYDAIIPAYDEDLFKQIKNFLEKINYIGYANFDFKYNKLTKKYYLFEINIRQGRSHSFTTLGGKNITKYLVDDMIYHKKRKIEYLNTEYLWTIVSKKILLNYVYNIDIKEKIIDLYNKHKVKNILYFNKDFSLLRYIKLYKRNFASKYEQFYKQGDNLNPTFAIIGNDFDLSTKFVEKIIQHTNALNDQEHIKMNIIINNKLLEKDKKYLQNLIINLEKSNTNYLILTFNNNDIYNYLKDNTNITILNNQFNIDNFELIKKIINISGKEVK